MRSTLLLFPLPFLPLPPFRRLLSPRRSQDIADVPCDDRVQRPTDFSFHPPVARETRRRWSGPTLAVALAMGLLASPAQAQNRLESMAVGARVEDSCEIVAVWDQRLNVNLQCSDHVKPLVEERPIGPLIASLPGTVLTVVTW